MWIKVSQSTPMETKEHLRLFSSDIRVRDKERLRILNVLDGDVFSACPQTLKKYKLWYLNLPNDSQVHFQAKFPGCTCCLKTEILQNHKKKKLKSKGASDLTVLKSHLCKKKIIQLITEMAIFIVAAFNVQFHVYVMVSWWFDAGM